MGKTNLKERLHINKLPIDLGIFLDQTDLLQLALLNSLSSSEKFSNPKAKISVPNYKITASQNDLLKTLAERGRIKIKNRSAKHSLTPTSSGNTVIEPTIEDESVMETFKDVDRDVLRPLLELSEQFPRLLTSATLFPNISRRSLKGVRLQFNQSQDKYWWQKLALYNWPLGRGILTIALPIEMEQLIGESDRILPKMIEMGMVSRSIKYIRLFYGIDQRVFMVLSDGPSDDERLSISNQLKNIHRPQEAVRFMKQVEDFYYQRRQEASKEILNLLSMKDGEQVVNTPYVYADGETGNAVSGGVSRGFLLPLTLRDAMIIHEDKSDKTYPLGLTRKETKKSVPGFVSTVDFLHLLDSLKNPLMLTDLQSVFHRR